MGSGDRESSAYPPLSIPYSPFPFWLSPRDLPLRDLAARLLVARADLGHACLHLLAGQDLLLDHEVAHGADPLLVVGGAIVLLLAVVLDDAAHAVDREGALAWRYQQPQHGVGSLLPQGEVVLLAVDGPEGEPAHVMHRAPGALAFQRLPLRTAHLLTPRRRGSDPGQTPGA